MQTVKAKIFKVDKLRGVRIPTAFLEQAGLRSEVQVEVTDGTLVIHAVKPPREGWVESAREMARQGDDVLLDGYVPTQFDEEEWEW